MLVGPGARHLLAAELAARLPAVPRRVAVVTSDGIGVEVDPGAGIATETFTIPAGERSKSLATVEDLCRRFSRFGLTRGDAVVAVGGGLVTDVAGFAAAVYHRGTPVAFVPTTLLGQIDAAIGGKTGVNLPEGKNLVGGLLAAVAGALRHRGAGHAARSRVPLRTRRDGQVPLPERG